MVRGLLIIVIVTTLASPFGCESTPSGAKKLNLATRQYASHRYEEAYRLARESAQSSSGTKATANRCDANYVAGLCAYEMGDLAEAEYRLTEAAKSTTAETRAKATAMLGVVRIRQNRYAEAARLLLSAAPNLSPAAARKARLHASIAAGSNPGSFDQFASNSGPVTVRVASASSAPTQTRAFALQVGAFRERVRAEEAASDVRSAEQGLPVGPVRIVTRLDDRGHRLYVVQLGQYSSRGEATRARADLGHLEYIVTHTGGGVAGSSSALAYP